MDKKVFSVKSLKKALRKSTHIQKKGNENLPKFSYKKSTKYTSDRFIPSRIDYFNSTLDSNLLNIFSKSKDQKKNEKSSYLKMIESELIENSTPKYKEIAFSLITKQKLNETKRRSIIYNDIPKKIRTNLASNLSNMQEYIDDTMFNPTKTKLVQPIKTFDFGLLADNFYSNVFDWQVSESALVATKKSMVLFNPLKYNQESINDRPSVCYDSNSEITALKQLSNEHVVVCDSNCVLFDSKSFKFIFFINYLHFIVNKNIVSELKIHNNKIMSIDMIDENLIILGSENSFVFFLDLRFKNSLTPLYEHMNEVCKVKYNPSLNMIVSGGNDNKIFLYDMRGKSKYLKVFSHSAAIKALDFEKNRPVLISGGGTFDKKIKMWDLKKFELINEKLTDSQISNIYCWKNNIITANGFVSNNIEIWKNDFTLHKIFQFKPHQKRILFLTKSSCEKYLLSGSCDGNINLWKIPEENDKRESILTNEMVR